MILTVMGFERNHCLNYLKLTLISILGTISKNLKAIRTIQLFKMYNDFLYFFLYTSDMCLYSMYSCLYNMLGSPYIYNFFLYYILHMLYNVNALNVL